MLGDSGQLAKLLLGLDNLVADGRAPFPLRECKQPFVLP